MFNTQYFLELFGMLLVFIVSVMLAACYQRSLNGDELDSSFKRFCARTIVVLPCACLIGFRALDVGYDTENMTALLYSNHSDIAYLISTQHDPFSIIISWILYIVLFGNTTLYLFIYSYLTLYLGFYAIEKWHTEVSISAAWFVYCTYFALLGMDQFKQVLCLSVVLLAVYYVCHGCKLKFVILAVLATGLHFTAIVSFAFLPLKLVEKSKLGLKSLCVVGLIAAAISVETLFGLAASLFGQGAYANYFSGYKFETEWSVGGGTGLSAVLHLAPCVFPLVFAKSIPDKHRWIISSMLLLAVPLRLLGYESQFLMRLYYEPALAMIVAYPLIARSLQGGGRAAFQMISVLLLLGYYFIAFMTSHGCVPYSLSFF